MWCNREYHLHPNIVCLLSNQLTWVSTDTNSDKNNLWSYLQIMYSVYILDVTREMIFTNDCIILPWWVSGVFTIWSTTIRHSSNWNCQETNKIGAKKVVNYKGAWRIPFVREALLKPSNENTHCLQVFWYLLWFLVDCELTSYGH